MCVCVCVCVCVSVRLCVPRIVGIGTIPESSLCILGIPTLLHDSRIVLRYSRIAQGLYRDNFSLRNPLAQYRNNSDIIAIQEVKMRFIKL